MLIAIKRDFICRLLWLWKLPVLRQIKLTVNRGVFLLGAATRVYVEGNYMTSRREVNTFPFIWRDGVQANLLFVARETYVQC